MKITKQEALAKIEELKKYIDEPEKKEEKVIGIAIKNRWTGDIIFQSTKTTYKEAIEEKSDTDLSNANLSNANLRNTDLRNANLSNTDLSNTDLRDANLYNAILSNANLSNTDLRDANLSNANLHNAILSNANLSNAILSNAILSNAEMQNCKFYGKGGSIRLNKSQLKDFLLALGFVIEE
ncbi:MAG: pentapeptide repeat-containing protein [Candidatus Heimdallarchaeaceae archaeon]